MANELEQKIAKTISELRDTKKYSIINRMMKADFFNVYKDGVYEHPNHHILIERFYRTRRCTKKKVPTYSMSNKTLRIKREIEDLVGNLDNLDEKEATRSKKKIDSKIEKLKDEKPVMKDIEALVYENDVTGDEFVMTRLHEVPEDSIDVLAGHFANYAMNHISFITMLSPSLFSFEPIIIDIGSESDYIDLIVNIKLESRV